MGQSDDRVCHLSRDVTLLTLYCPSHKPEIKTPHGGPRDLQGS